MILLEILTVLFIIYVVILMAVGAIVLAFLLFTGAIFKIVDSDGTFIM